MTGFAALVAAAWFGPGLIDWDRFRTKVADGASAGLDRPVTIAGPISLSLWPRPTLTAAAVDVADAGDGVSATVREMRLQVDMAALLTGRVEIRDLALRDAAIRLPWPPGVTQWSVTQWGAGELRHGPPAWLTRLHARIENGTLQVGGLSVTRIDGELSADAVTGALSAHGLAELLGRRWRVGARLGEVGGDGSATLDVSLDGDGETADTGGVLTGQIAVDGTLEGQVRGRGPDLSLLLAAPASPWRASGRISAGGGLALASDLDVEIGGLPATGALALRVLPVPRIDAALSASRLDLDAWLPALLHGGASALPTGLDLSAEQATLAGGTLRRLRAGLQLTPSGVTVREAEMALPGSAALQLSGSVAEGRFRGDGQLDAPDLRATLRWLRPLAPALIDALPPGALHAAAITAHIQAGDGVVSLAQLAGRIDGAAMTGEVSVHPDAHPALAATLAVTGLPLDAWLPEWVSHPLLADPAAWSAAWASLPQRWAGFDLELALDATRPTWRGLPLDAFALDTRVSGDGWEVRRAALQAPGGTASVAFKLAADGRLSDGQMTISLPRSQVAGEWWPSLRLPPALLQGAWMGQAMASGLPGALAVNASAEIDDARLEAAGTADLAHLHWSGAIAARHPGAPRLLAALGVPGAVAWLGDGSMSLQSQADAAPGLFALKDAKVAAGGLRATTSLALDLRGAVPVLTGQVAAETLPLPLLHAASAEPLPFNALPGWQARVGLRADRVTLELAPALTNLTADIVIAGGGARLDGVFADLAGGRVIGSAAIDPAGEAAPRLRMQAALTDILVQAPLLDAVPDLVAGRVTAAVTVQATGYSPAALLATLTGQAAGSIRDGVLAGTDLGAAMAALHQDDPAAVRRGIAQALDGGTTPFQQLDFMVAAKGGAVTLQRAAMATPAGTVDIAGLVDLPAGSEDIRLLMKPQLAAAAPEAMPAAAAPQLEVRLIGPVARPQRVVGLADLTRFLAERRPASP